MMLPMAAALATAAANQEEARRLSQAKAREEEARRAARRAEAAAAREARQQQALLAAADEELAAKTAAMTRSLLYTGSSAARDMDEAATTQRSPRRLPALSAAARSHASAALVAARSSVTTARSSVTTLSKGLATVSPRRLLPPTLSAIDIVTLQRGSPYEPLGLNLEPAERSASWAVAHLAPGGLAARSRKLRVGDQIIAINGSTLGPQSDFGALMSGMEAVKLLVKR